MPFLHLSLICFFAHLAFWSAALWNDLSFLHFDWFYSAAFAQHAKLTPYFLFVCPYQVNRDTTIVSRPSSIYGSRNPSMANIMMTRRASQPVGFGFKQRGSNHGIHTLPPQVCPCIMISGYKFPTGSWSPVLTLVWPCMLFACIFLLFDCHFYHVIFQSAYVLATYSLYTCNLPSSTW